MKRHAPQPLDNSASKKWNGYSHPEGAGWYLTGKDKKETINNHGKTSTTKSTEVNNQSVRQSQR